MAGLPDKTPCVSKLFAVGIFVVKRLSIYLSARKRRLIHSYLQRENIRLEIFNGGGTGSLLSTSSEPWITEVINFLLVLTYPAYAYRSLLAQVSYKARYSTIIGQMNAYLPLPTLCESQEFPKTMSLFARVADLQQGT